MKVHHIIIFENHLRIEAGPVLSAALAEINRKLDKVLSKETTIMADLTSLTQEVADTKAGEESAITLITGLAAAIAAAGTDPVKLQALQDSLAAERSALAAAVAANPVP